jgi:CheY-like chemotaxis protein
VIDRLDAAAVPEGAPVPSGSRVLLVEDEFFVAIDVEDTLQSLGCETIGPFARLEVATEAARNERFEVAILDINLDGSPVFPLADELADRGIPFLFLTGYAAADLPEAYRTRPRLQKPFDRAAVARALRELLSA